MFLNRLRNNIPFMIVSAKREQFERNVAEGRVHRGMGRGRLADPAPKVHEPETQPEKHHMEEEEVENTDDVDEQPQVEVEVEPQQLHDYHGGLNDVFVLTQYHLHVVRFYIFNFFVLFFFFM